MFSFPYAVACHRSFYVFSEFGSFATDLYMLADDTITLALELE